QQLAQVGFNTCRHLHERLAAMAHLHHRCARTVPIQQFLLGAFQHVFRHRGRAGTEVPRSRHGSRFLQERGYQRKYKKNAINPASTTAATMSHQISVCGESSGSGSTMGATGAGCAMAWATHCNPGASTTNRCSPNTIWSSGDSRARWQRQPLTRGAALSDSKISPSPVCTTRQAYDSSPKYRLPVPSRSSGATGRSCPDAPPDMTRKPAWPGYATASPTSRTSTGAASAATRNLFAPSVTVSP